VGQLVPVLHADEVKVLKVVLEVMGFG